MRSYIIIWYLNKIVQNSSQNTKNQNTLILSLVFLQNKFKFRLCYDYFARSVEIRSEQNEISQFYHRRFALFNEQSEDCLPEINELSGQGRFMKDGRSDWRTSITTRIWMEREFSTTTGFRASIFYLHTVKWQTWNIHCSLFRIPSLLHTVSSPKMKMNWYHLPRIVTDAWKERCKW